MACITLDFLRRDEFKGTSKEEKAMFTVEFVRLLELVQVASEPIKMTYPKRGNHDNHHSKFLANILILLVMELIGGMQSREQHIASWLHSRVVSKRKNGDQRDMLSSRDNLPLAEIRNRLGWIVPQARISVQFILWRKLYNNFKMDSPFFFKLLWKDICKWVALQKNVHQNVFYDDHTTSSTVQELQQQRQTSSASSSTSVSTATLATRRDSNMHEGVNKIVGQSDGTKNDDHLHENTTTSSSLQRVGSSAGASVGASSTSTSGTTKDNVMTSNLVVRTTKDASSSFVNSSNNNLVVLEGDHSTTVNTQTNNTKHEMSEPGVSSSGEDEKTSNELPSSLRPPQMQQQQQQTPAMAPSEILQPIDFMLMKQGRSLEEQGLYELAFSKYQQAMQFTIQLHGSKHRSVAQAGYCCGFILLTKGAYTEAMETLKQAMEVAKNAQKRTSKPTGAAADGDGDDKKKKTGQQQEGKDEDDDDEQQRQEKMEDDTVLLVDIELAMGEAHAGLGQFEKALDMFLRVRSMLPQSNLPADVLDRRLAKILIEMARVYVTMSDFEKAEELLHECVQENSLENPMDVASMHVVQAEIFLARGDTETAQSEYQLALGFYTGFLPSGHHLILEIHGRLAFVHFKEGDAHEAVAILSKTIPLLQTALSSTNKKVFLMLMNMALALNSIGYKEKAKYILEIVLKQCEAIHPEHYITGEVMSALGEVLMENRSVDAGMTMLNSALELESKCFAGMNHVNIAQIRHRLGKGHVQNGKYEEALSEFNKSLRILEITLGKWSPSTRVARVAIASVYIFQKSYDQAVEMLVMVLAAIDRGEKGAAKSSSGSALLSSPSRNSGGRPRHSRVDAVQCSLVHRIIATIYYMKGDLTKCIFQHEQALYRLKKSTSFDDCQNPHPRICSTLFGIAHSLHQQGKFREAMERYHQAYGIREDYFSQMLNSSQELQANVQDVLEAMLQVYSSPSSYNGLGPYQAGESSATKQQQQLQHLQAVAPREDIEELAQATRRARTLLHTGDFKQTQAFLYAAQKRLVDGPLKVPLLCDLAKVLCNLRKIDDAKEQVQRALATAREYCGRESQVVSAILHDEGQILFQNGELKESLIRYKASLELKEVVFGESHPSTASTLAEVATVFSAMGSHDDALDCMKRSLRIRTEMLGEETPESCAGLLQYAAILTNGKKLDEASKKYREAYDISVKNSFSHILKSSALYGDAYIMRQRGKTTESLDKFKKALVIQEAHGLTVGAASTLLQLGELHDSLNHVQVAGDHFKKALNAMAKVFEGSYCHSDYVNAVKRVCDFYVKHHKHEDAKSCLVELLRVQKHLFGEEHHDYRDTQSKLREMESNSSDKSDNAQDSDESKNDNDNTKNDDDDDVEMNDDEDGNDKRSYGQSADQESEDEDRKETQQNNDEKRSKSPSKKNHQAIQHKDENERKRMKLT